MIGINNEARETLTVRAMITKREIEIIRYIAQGLTGKEIALQLNLSLKTIDAHKQNMMNKLGTRKSTEMVAIAYRMNWI